MILFLIHSIRTNNTTGIKKNKQTHKKTTLPGLKKSMILFLIHAIRTNNTTGIKNKHSKMENAGIRVETIVGLNIRCDVHECTGDEHNTKRIGICKNQYGIWLTNYRLTRSLWMNIIRRGKPFIIYAQYLRVTALNPVL